MVREADIEDPEPLRSAEMVSAARSSGRAADDNVSLLNDDLLDVEHVAL